MKTFSTQWKSSSNQKKQRKYRIKAPLHIKQKFLGAHLDKELMKKHGMRSLSLRTGDKVKIMRGQYKKKTGKIERIELKDTRVFVTGIEHSKKDGSKVLYPLHPSNLLLTELIIDDKKRRKHLDKKQPAQKSIKKNETTQKTEKKQ